MRKKNYIGFTAPEFIELFTLLNDRLIELDRLLFLTDESDCSYYELIQEEVDTVESLKDCFKAIYDRGLKR